MRHHVSSLFVETNLMIPDTPVSLYVDEELGSLQTILVAASD